MKRPLFTNVQPTELPILYRSVYFTWVGRIFAAVLLLMLVLSPLDATYAADEETASSSDAVVDDTDDTIEEELVPPEPEVDTAVATADSEEDEPDSSPESATEAEVVLPAADVDTRTSSTPESSGLVEESESGRSQPTESLDSTSTSGTASEAEDTTDSTTEVPVRATTSSQSATSSVSTTTVSDLETVDVATATSSTDGATATTSEPQVEQPTAEVAPREPEPLSTNDTDPAEEAEPEVEPEVDQATAVEESNEPTVSEATITNNNNRYQFADSECVAVADGSYYCQQLDGDHLELSDTVVFAELSASGYSDIFLIDADGTRALTNNQYEDNAPHYDPVSETVVWHRLVNDVYQIISYDIRRQSESQITDSAANNMQPVRSGEVLVWQTWSDNAWQIMLQEGTEDPVQLTTGSKNNIAPYVHGGYVIWNVTTPNQPREVAVYEISTGNISTIEDPDGGQVTNPRFVLMYDTKFDNGDVVTKGYNPETGELVPLSAVPGAPAPTIPSSDPVGETRALIQNKSNTEEDGDEVEVSTEPNPVASTTTSVASSTTATSSVSAESEAYTLTIPATTTATSTDSTSSSTASTTTALSEYDLPIAPFGTTTEAVTPTDVPAATTSAASSTQVNNS